MVLLIVAACVVGGMKYRAQATRERKAVLERMNQEQLARGELSPTAELFREAGAPMSVLAGGGSPTLATTGTGMPGSPSTMPSPMPMPMPMPTPAPAGPAGGTVLPPEAPTTADDAHPGSTADLAAMFAGIQMPAGLAPFGTMSTTSVAFVTGVGAREVQPALAAELERIGAEVRWVEPTVAQVQRAGGTAALTIYPRPEVAVDLDGNRMFPTAPPDSCVVRLALT